MDLTLLQQTRRYGDTAGLVNKITQGGPRTYNLGGRSRKDFRKRLHLPAGAKMINPYTYWGLWVFFPQAHAAGTHTEYQLQEDSSDIGADPQFHMRVEVWFDEWHHDFHKSPL